MVVAVLEEESAVLVVIDAKTARWSTILDSL